MSEWRTIDSAPEGELIWVFCEELEPQQFVASLTEGHEGPYWKPAEQLVAEVMDEYFYPSHWMPLPAPPKDAGP